MCTDYNDGMGDAQQFLSNNDEFYGLYLHKAKELSMLQAEHYMLQAEHLKWLNKYDALQKKYIALVEEDTKLIDSKNVPLLVTISALGVLVIMFSIEFFVWLAQ